jgi:hypothetical protein
MQSTEGTCRITRFIERRVGQQQKHLLYMFTPSEQHQLQCLTDRKVERIVCRAVLMTSN